MRSKMLGLAIALTTFGLGVTATTLWIAYNTPTAPVPAEIVTTRTELVAVPETILRVNDSTACPSSRAASAGSVRAISGGILNGKAIAKPQPRYPPQAMAAQVSGTVIVFIVVNECGEVETARIVSGPELLQQAALDSVIKWRFTPTRLSGQPVKVSGTVNFNFLLQ